MLVERAARYAEVAELRLPTDGRSPAEVADELLRALVAARA